MNKSLQSSESVVLICKHVLMILAHSNAGDFRMDHIRKYMGSMYVKHVLYVCGLYM